jgi:hypothetical protein
MIGAAGEKVLPRRVQPQPTPDIHLGGDCGACVLGGALGLTVPEVYSRFGSKGVTNPYEMKRLLRCASSLGLADRVIEEPADWNGDCRHWGAFGKPAFLNALEWFNHVRMAIDAGYYGLAMVDFKRGGGIDTDHWILICGARTEGSVVGKTLTGEVLVSCSARSSGMRDEWVEARDFLKNRGGYETLFLRPAGAP